MLKTSLPRLRLRVTAAAETWLRHGHPWLFAGSVREQNRVGELGELAVVYDRQDRFLAVGLYDPDSPICLRVLHTGKPANIDTAWWQASLQRTFQKWEAHFDPQTTGYRCLNGESDLWPGLVLDRYDQTFVLKIYSGIWFQRLDAVAELISAQQPNERIVLRLSRNIQDAAGKLNRHDGQILQGTPVLAPVVFQETGLWFAADVLRGQKTGFFLDQRENRRRVETLARGRRVLNAFSFSGGFSLYAARGGAESVTDLDISAHALTAAQRNFALNAENPSVARVRHETIQTDAFAWLQKNVNRTFDLVILDPPSLAKRETERAEAIHAYGRLATGGLRHLAPGGILVAASCSAHVSAEEFFTAVREAAKGSGRKFVEMQTTRHAPDHPATFPEAEYLKCVYLRVES